jgi:hypothetical protein
MVMRLTVSETILIWVSPVTVPEVAWIVAVPGASAVTNPSAFTRATVSGVASQLRATPERGLPFFIRGVAVRTTLPPTSSGLPGAVMSIEVTAGVATLTCANPGFPPRRP